MEQLNNVNDIRSRLFEFISTTGLSGRAFLKRVGLSGGYIQIPKKSVSADAIAKIKKEFPNFNPDYVNYGEGSVTLGEKPDEDVSEIDKLRETVAKQADEIQALNRRIDTLLSVVQNLSDGIKK